MLPTICNMLNPPHFIAEKFVPIYQSFSSSSVSDKPQPPALEVWSLSHLTTREIPICGLLKEKKRLTLRKRVESGCQKLRGWGLSETEELEKDW